MIQKVERVLPGGVTDALLDDDSDGVPYGLDIDYGVRYEILNSTDKQAFALFEREGGGTFEYIQEFPKVVSRPLGPASAAAAAATGSSPGALTLSPGTSTPGMAPFVTLGLPTSNLGSPIDVTLPARSITTVEFSLRFPLLDPCEARPGGDVIVGCAGVEPIRQCGAGKRHVKWKHTCLRVTADHVGAELRGEAQLETIGGSTIKSDKWTTYLPGADAHHESTHTPISEREAQEVELRAVLVEMPRRASDPERVVRGKFVSKFSGLLSWKLTQVSTHPGIATNSGELTDRRGDMSFEADTELREPLPETVRLLPMFSRKLFVKDYAASARIHAELKILDGGKVSQRLHPKTTDRQLPTDEDRDGLPDYWEKSIAQSPSMTAGADLDEDRFQVHAEPGDGLSAWEEARGFRVKGKHYRTDEMLDDTPLVGGGTVGDNNKGGPHRKDLFIDDSSDLFAGNRQQTGDGALTALYGVSAHLIHFSESFLPRSDPLRFQFGQINRLTPADYRVAMQGDLEGQFRLRIVPDTSLGVYGDAQAEEVRSPASVLLNVDLLERRLRSTSPGGYGFTGKDPKIGARIESRVRTLLAHEMGHRFTLLHPLVTIPVSRQLVTTGSTLSSDERPAAAVFERDEVRTVRIRQGGTTKLVRTSVRPVKVRVVADQVFFPQPTGLQVYPVRFPKEIVFPAKPAEGAIPFFADRRDNTPPTPDSSQPLFENPPGGIVSFREQLIPRTLHYLIQPLDDRRDLVDEITAGRALIRFYEIPFEALQRGERSTVDWMLTGQGSLLFPGNRTLEPRLRLMRMKSPRMPDLDKEEFEQRQERKIGP